MVVTEVAGGTYEARPGIFFEWPGIAVQNATAFEFRLVLGDK